MKKLYIIIILFIILLIAIIWKFPREDSSSIKNTEKKSPTIVEITRLKEQNIIDKIESTGRIKAKYITDLVARVDGFLQKRYFEEGAMVKKGDLLFLIEPDQYQIQVNEAIAAINQTKALLNEAENNLLRASELVKREFISKSEYDKVLAERDSTKASLEFDETKLSRAKLNLEYTKIYSPINGKIGQINITEGNFVSQASGTIAKIVSIDPIFVDFNVKSSDYLSLKRGSANANLDLSDINVKIKLPDGKFYNQEGIIKFFDNEIDEESGTIKARAEFKNPQGLLVPGDYVNVVSSLNKPRKVVLILQEAVLENSDGKYVYVLDETNTVKTRPIKVDGQYTEHWILTEGLTKEDKVVSSGHQKLKQGTKVQVTTDKQKMGKGNKK